MNQNTSKINLLEGVPTVVGWIAGASIIYFGYWLAALIIIIPAIIGYLMSTWIDEKKIPKAVLSVLEWFNVAAWLIPPLGVLIAVITLNVNQNFQKNLNKKRYKVVGWLGLTASLVNALTGIILAKT